MASALIAPLQWVHALKWCLHSPFTVSTSAKMVSALIAHLQWVHALKWGLYLSSFTVSTSAKIGSAQRKPKHKFKSNITPNENGNKRTFIHSVHSFDLVRLVVYPVFRKKKIFLRGFYGKFICITFNVFNIYHVIQRHRRRIYTVEKANVVAVVCGTELIQILAAL